MLLAPSNGAFEDRVHCFVQLTSTKEAVVHVIQVPMMKYTTSILPNTAYSKFFLLCLYRKQFIPKSVATKKTDKHRQMLDKLYVISAKYRQFLGTGDRKDWYYASSFINSTGQRPVELMRYPFVRHPSVRKQYLVLSPS